jgi:hypothetical protein
VEERLAPLEGKTYFQILRVGPDTDQAQVERAYKFLARKVGEEPRDAGTIALSGVLREAWSCLRDPARHARYTAAAAAERRALEAEPKLERCVRALGEGRTEEARYLARWAARLAPRRAEIGALVSGIDWLSESGEGRGPSPRGALTAEARRTGDRRIKLVLAAVLAREGEARAARALIVEAQGLGHPLTERVLSEVHR